MPITEQTLISAITVLEDGQLQIRRSRRIFDGTDMIAEQYHRHVLAPGDDLTMEDDRVKDMANLLWTQAVISAYQEKKASRES
jgi:hypothetical protein